MKWANAAITALTAQNPRGVKGVHLVPPSFIAEQLSAVFEMYSVKALKTGMLATADAIATVAKCLEAHPRVKKVIDPVMVATSGAKLLEDDATGILKEFLFPLATVITPNIPEAEILSGEKISGPDDMERAAKIIFDKYKCAVLCKGGHSVNDANDFLLDESGGEFFAGEKILTTNTHGTGCTLSSAIAAGLAKGFSLRESVGRAKKYLSGALKAGLNLGKGSGPMNHAFCIENGKW